MQRNCAFKNYQPPEKFIFPEFMKKLPTLLILGKIAIYAKKKKKISSNSKSYYFDNLSRILPISKAVILCIYKKSALENSAFQQPTAKIGANFAYSRPIMLICNQLGRGKNSSHP